MKPALALAAMLLTTTGASAGRLQTLHIFDGADGAWPRAALAADGQGNFYGTTYKGGGNHFGTVFKVDAEHRVTTLHRFQAGHGAGHPSFGALLVASDGSLIGTADRADRETGSTIYKLSPDGSETLLHRFDKQDPMGFGMFAGVIADGDGNLYGATEWGSKFHCGAVFRLSPDGTMTRLYAFGGGADGCNPSGPLTRDANGNLYGVTMTGGIAASGFGNVGTVYKISPGGHEAVLHAFDWSNLSGDGVNPMGPLLLEADGSLVGTTYYGNYLDAPDGTVYRLAPDGTETVLHKFSNQETRGGANPIGGVISDAKGNLYGTTQQGGPIGLGTVFKLTPNGKEKLLHWFKSSDGSLPEAGLVMDAQGNLLGNTTHFGISRGTQRGTLFEVDTKRAPVPHRGLKRISRGTDP